MDADDELARRQLSNGSCPENSISSLFEANEEFDLNNGKCGEFGEMSFHFSSYVRALLNMMRFMRDTHTLCDVILEVGSEEFHAHKIILAASSQYFRSMFTGGMKECTMTRVKLQGVCPTAMIKIVKFLYTGNISINEGTVCSLLPASMMFQVTSVTNACCAFLEKQLDPSNAIGIANFAEQYGCVQLMNKANQFIMQHFCQICQQDEFLQLSAVQLVSLIRKDELNVREELEVYNAVVKWAKYNEEARGPKMEHILRAVRCQYLTPNFLREQMKHCEVMKKLPACREYLAQIFKELTLHKKPVVNERTPNTPRIIFMVGGFLEKSLDLLEGFNVDDKTWTIHAKLLVPRSGVGAAFLKGYFYAVGGRNNTPGQNSNRAANRYDSDWVDRYNPATNNWRACSPLTVPRNRVGVAVMDGLLYAVGGSSNTETHNSVECYDPESDTWTYIKAMHTRRLGVGVAVVNRLLYAIGGYDGTNRLKSVECYHPENDEWNIVAEMQICRSGAGTASIGQYIYVVGGYDGESQLSSVERYDTEKNIWEYVSPLKIARSALSLTSIDNKLYAMGGFDGTSFVNIVEIYDPSKDTWEEGVPMTSGRSGHATAVSYQICSGYCDHLEDNDDEPKAPS